MQENGSGGHFIETLTKRSQLFLFAYATNLKSLVSWSENAEQVLGVKDVAIAQGGNLFLRHVHPDDRFLLMTELESALSGSVPYRATYRWIRPDNNEVRWLHCRAAIITRSGEPLFEGMLIDISSEMLGVAGAGAGVDSIGSILAAFPTTLVTLDHDLRLLRIHRPEHAPSVTFGDPAFKSENFRVGRPFLACFQDLTQRTHYHEVLQQILDGTRTIFRGRIAKDQLIQNIEIHPLKERDNIQGALVLISDTSELARLERQLAELNKAEGLRLLAAGMAHNFNNALQAILGHAAAMNSHANRADLVKEASQSILDIVKKTADLTRELIELDTSNASSVAVAVEVNLAAMSAVNKIEDLFVAGLKIGVIFGTPPAVLARHEQLVQVLEGLIRNGRESMQRGGSLTIRTSQIDLKDLEIEDLRAGEYAKISITDSGSGMAADARQRCTEPFFTTKNVDPATGLGLKGEGLGMAKAQSVVRGFGGALTIESNPGFGTAIAIYIPALEQHAIGRSSLVQLPESSPAPEVLIIDDDELVLSTVAAMVSRLGVRCATAENYHKALAIIRQHGEAIRLILLDAVMPGMDGPAVLRQIRRISPAIPVIGFTGAPLEHAQRLLDAGATRILRKPVAPETLQALLTELVHGQKAA